MKEGCVDSRSTWFHMDIRLTVTVYVNVLPPVPPRWYGPVEFGMECPGLACVSSVRSPDQIVRAASATEVMWLYQQLLQHPVWVGSAIGKK